MTKEEFKDLRVGTILLTGHNFVEITKKHEDGETFDGMLYTPYPLNLAPRPVQGLSWVNVDFFDIPEDKFVADCIRQKQPITHDAKDNYTVHGVVDVVCRDGLVKYFAIIDVGMSFIGSVVRHYKNIKP